jgi:uncharacterized protein DUF202
VTNQTAKVTDPDASTILSVDRTRLAHDRTMLSWIRTATALAHLGPLSRRSIRNLEYRFMKWLQAYCASILANTFFTRTKNTVRVDVEGANICVRCCL